MGPVLDPRSLKHLVFFFGSFQKRSESILESAKGSMAQASYEIESLQTWIDSWTQNSLHTASGFDSLAF